MVAKIQLFSLLYLEIQKYLLNLQSEDKVNTKLNPLKSIADDIETNE